MKKEELEVNNGLPNGWKKIKISEVCFVKNGMAFKSSSYLSIGIPIIRISNINSNEIDLNNTVFTEENIEFEDFIINNGDILIAMSGATTGKMGLYKSNVISYQNQRVGNIKLFDNNLTEKNFIFYFFKFQKTLIEKIAYGGAQPNISSKMIEQLIISLPPLNEQKRIVAKIEKLFSNLDNSDKYLLHLEKQLKRYRQSVLKSAFEGELTKEWREKQTNLETADELLENIKKERILYIENEIREKFKDKPEKWIKDKINSGIKKYLESLIILRNDILPKSWSETFLQCLTFEHTQDIVDGPFGSNLKASEYQENGIPIIRLQNIDRNIFIDKNIQFVSEKKAEQLKRHSYKQGDIVITKLGAPLGKACIIPDTIDDGIIVADVVRLRLFEKYFDKKYVSYFINSNYPISQLEVLVKGTTRPRVNLTHIRELRVYICSILEQQEIVNQIEKHFSIIDKLEVVVQQSIKESKRLRQSILKQAFEGKLVEQDPNDESASILLEKIAKAKEEYQKAMKRKK